MQDFKTSKNHIILQGVLLFSLLVLTFSQHANTSPIHLPVMLIVDTIVLIFFVASLMRKVTITNDEIIVKNYTKVSKVNLNKITYADGLSAIARFVIILSDNKSSLVFSSLIDDFDKIVDILNSKLPEDEKDKLYKLNKHDIAAKKRSYNFLMIALTCIVWAGVLKSFLS